MYDRASITQFVDSLLNNNHINKEENVYECIDDDSAYDTHSSSQTHTVKGNVYKLANTTPLTNQILAKGQTFVQAMKSSTSSSSSSSSSSSGCVSGDISSNVDVTLSSSTCSISSTTNTNSSATVLKAEQLHRPASLYRNSNVSSSLLVSSSSCKNKLSIDTSVNYPIMMLGSAASSSSSSKTSNLSANNAANSNTSAKYKFNQPLTPVTHVQPQVSPGSVAGLAATFISNSNSKQFY